MTVINLMTGINSMTVIKSMTDINYFKYHGYNNGIMITGGLIRKRVLLMTSPRGTAHKKLKEIDRFGHENRVNSSNFNATILRFAEKFYIHFRTVLHFPESHGFVAVPVTSSNNFVSLHN